MTSKMVLDNSMTTRLGEMVLAKMEEKGLSIRTVANSLSDPITYEHMRRIVRGETMPSKYVLREICSKLDLDYKEAEKAGTTDKIEKHYGSVATVLAGKNPELEPMDRVWGKLTDEQKQSLLDMANGMAKRNKISH